MIWPRNSTITKARSNCPPDAWTAASPGDCGENVRLWSSNIPLKSTSAWRYGAKGMLGLGGAIPFVHFADLNSPTTVLAKQLADEQGLDGLAIVSEEVVGLVVVTQTCDLIRTCRDRPGTWKSALSSICQPAKCR